MACKPTIIVYPNVHDRAIRHGTGPLRHICQVTALQDKRCNTLGPHIPATVLADQSMWQPQRLQQDNEDCSLYWKMSFATATKSAMCLQGYWPDETLRCSKAQVHAYPFPAASKALHAPSGDSICKRLKASDMFGDIKYAAPSTTA